ncbi:MAG TPA: HD domain-containing phosphohydrolase [Solirubrobacteraceae bacterium]|nr:HD domain-containing phosphohydrolase [Solirubrobacteraceae bacterium]
MTDLGTGLGFEKGLQTCVVACAFGRALGLDDDACRTIHHTALLRAVGCTASAPENAAMFGDDVAFQAAFKTLDPGDPDVFAGQLEAFGSWAGRERQPALAARFVEVAPTAGPLAVQMNCEVSAALGTRLGLAPAAIAALDEIHERWDGLGLPAGIEGDALSLPVRVVHVAEQAVLACAAGGVAAAQAEVRRRAGGHLDPELCRRFVEHAEEVLEPLSAADMLTAVAEAEPRPTATLPADHLNRVCIAFAAFADLKGTHLVGHSTRVAHLAGAAAGLLGMDEPSRESLRTAALVHDLGRAAVSSAIWDRPAALGPADRERVRLHPYWTGRVLAHCPALAPLEVVAAAHHERIDGSGYPRGARGGELSLSARVLAAADAFSAMTEDRPHRPARDREEAARILLEDATSGRQDPEAAAAVIEAAGLPRPRAAWPCDLTDREVEVLRLAARGAKNQEIASALVVSPRTVQHHLASIYDKTGRRTRAGAAVFAIEHNLIAAGAQ